MTGTTPLRAIRAKCLDCCCNSAQEVKLCPAQNCPLWPFRSGHNPARAGIGGKGVTAKKPDSRANFEAQNEECDEVS